MSIISVAVGRTLLSLRRRNRRVYRRVHIGKRLRIEPYQLVARRREYRLAIFASHRFKERQLPEASERVARVRNKFDAIRPQSELDSRRRRLAVPIAEPSTSDRIPNTRRGFFKK